MPGLAFSPTSCRFFAVVGLGVPYCAKMSDHDLYALVIYLSTLPPLVGKR